MDGIVQFISVLWIEMQPITSPFPARRDSTLPLFASAPGASRQPSFSATASGVLQQASEPLQVRLVVSVTQTDTVPLLQQRHDRDTAAKLGLYRCGLALRNDVMRGKVESFSACSSSDLI
jgi:hypothetical protein